MKFKICSIIVQVMILISIINVEAKIDSSYIEINLRGSISGSYLINNLNFARIQNPSLPVESTIGMFSDPPSKSFPFDIAMILGNLGKQKIEIGDYKAVGVVNDVPNLQIGQKGGFMTIVPTGQTPPKVEYFTTSGTFSIVEIVDNVRINGIFELILKSTDGSRVINASGKFRIVFDN